eukprot:6213184-Pleurochrysis_carterae.AAC.2
MGAFTSNVMFTNREVRLHQASCFTEFVEMAASGTLFRRPFSKPSFLAHLTDHPPIFGKLQSSYADVEAELNILRNRHLNERFLFVGGDRLSIIRVNHLLRDNPALYIDSARHHHSRTRQVASRRLSRHARRIEIVHAILRGLLAAVRC